MRIKWNAENAREIRRALEEIRSSLERCAGMSDQIHAAFTEADPDRGNKRLRRLEESCDAAMRRVRRLMEETEELSEATETMTSLFDESEEEALRLLSRLEVGTAAGLSGTTGASKGMHKGVTAETTGRLPIRVPRPVIAPMPRVTGYGPVPDWLRELANR